MLTLTDSASTIIKDLTDHVVVADDAGLRISTSAEDSGNLTVDVTPAPEPDDQVVENAGARVFLEGHAAEVLADKVLDAELDSDGKVRFAVTDQP
jgi:iron-sulfur cluster assembly protein